MFSVKGPFNMGVSTERSVVHAQVMVGVRGFILYLIVSLGHFDRLWWGIERGPPFKDERQKIIIRSI